jgi:hypothetical protein
MLAAPSALYHCTIHHCTTITCSTHRCSVLLAAAYCLLISQNRSPAAGTSSKAAAAACPADSETGPSPAAACGLPAAQQQVNHRVVRRLDQHEAWGAPLAASPAKGSAAWAAAGSAVKPPKGDGLLGTGLSLFSPVKKQRVPLFSEGSGIHIGASPAKPEPTDLPGAKLASIEQGRQRVCCMRACFGVTRRLWAGL